MRKLLAGVIKYLVPLVISVGLCWLLFTDLDINEILRIIREQCDLRWIVLGFGLSIFAQVCRAYRWRIQLCALGIKPSARALVYSVFGTYAVNLVFPRLGEVWRTTYISQLQHASFVTVFGSMVADRLADTVAVALLTLFTLVIASGAILSFLAENGEAYLPIVDLLLSPMLWAAVLICLAGGWYFMTRSTDNRFVNKVRRTLRSLWQGFAVVGHMPGKRKWLLLTAGIWGGYFLQTYVSFYAFPFTRALVAEHGMTVALVAFVLGSISMGVPSNGGIGPWQWAVIFALGIYGLPAEEAAAFANLSLGTTTLLTIFLGIITFAGIALDKKRNNNELQTTKT